MTTQHNSKDGIFFLTEPKNQLLDTYCLYIGVELKSSLSLKAMCKL